MQICFFAIAFYFAEKKNGNQLARNKIGLLSEKLSITSVDESAVRKTALNKSIKDFEDGLEYYSAEDSNCRCIITQDKKDFYFSEMKVLNAKAFLLKYAMKKKR